VIYERPISYNDLLVQFAGVGVDVTRMDLSQFDEATGRNVPTAPHSPSPPDVIVTAGSQDELELEPQFLEGTESVDVVPKAEATHR